MISYAGKINYCDLESLDVVNVVDGAVLGTIVDLEIEISSGKICSITVSGTRGILSILSPEKGIIIPWDQIIKIGEDVIIVNYNCSIH